METRVIYVLGSSFSGTTLLGYLLGSLPQVVDAGELKFFNRIQGELDDVYCSCGKRGSECPFWSSLYERRYRIFEVPSFRQAVDTALTGALGLDLGISRPIEADDALFLRDFLALARRREPEVRYVVDVSKSLWRLDHLARTPGIALKVVYIQRGIRGNVASFVRHQMGFWKGLVTYLVLHFLATRFLDQAGFDHTVIQYEDLCQDTQAVLDDIGAFLGVDYNEYLHKLGQAEYHVLAGNRGTQQQFIEGFQQVRYDDRWKTTLSGWQKTLLGWLEPRAPEDLGTDDSAQETGAPH